MNGKLDKRSETDGDVCEGVFFFHPDDGIYRDHFPGYPVVPGSLIIHAFLKAVQKAGFGGNYVAAEDFRFRQFLRPGQYSFRIVHKEGRVNCLIHEGNKKLVTGAIKK